MANDEKDLQGDEPNEGGGGKKKLLIIVAAVLLLVISGAAAMFLLGGDDPAEGEEAAEAEAQPLADPIYHEFDPQFVVNLPPGGRARMLQVKLQVMTRDQAVVDYIARNDPMLRHHLFNLFSGQDASTLYGREGREALAKAVEEQLESTMKDQGFEGDVEAVYFTELVLQ
jgi:flagellar FliL protein